MKDTLKPGLVFRLSYKVPEEKTVPGLYEEAPEFQVMPRVFATGFMVGLVEWTCVRLLAPHLDWPEEQSVGIAVNLNHTAATPPGYTVSIEATLLEVDGRRLLFKVVGHDGEDQITEGTHERFVINAARFNAKVEEKAARAR